MANDSDSADPTRSVWTPYVLVLVAGAAALSWELLWQMRAALALGVSAVGAALILATTMGGMALGSALAGRWVRRHPGLEPLRVYGALELLVGLSGLLMLPGFEVLEGLDAWIYGVAPGVAPAAHALGIAALLGPPTLAMGATLPVLGVMARQHNVPLSRLYALNTGGAALGVLAMAFGLLPALGVGATVGLAVSLNVTVAGAAWLVVLRRRRAGAPRPAPSEDPAAVSRGGDSDEAAHSNRPGTTLSLWQARVVVFGTGAATFALEVAWFRSMRATFQATTDSFAIMLASVLLPLALSARLVPVLRRRGLTLGHALGGAAVAVLLSTPVVERFDLLVPHSAGYWATLGLWLGASLLVIGTPVLLLGLALPWVLDLQSDPRRWGGLYALNTLGAVAGSLLAAWVVLPAAGYAPTCWLAGLTLAGLAAWVGRDRARWALLGGAAAATLVAVWGRSGLGRERVQSYSARQDYNVLAYREEPDSTVSVLEYTDGHRALLIDGFHAASELSAAHYMKWMGHLPMMLHPSPGQALVICFGTGQTANAVRNEGPARLDVVDLSASVFELGGHFSSNEGVLQDERVHPIVMDGRAWLRRTRQRYDVVTLEPMPPNFAGVNALYSLEFYRLLARRLRPGGVVAQWVPFHLLPPSHAAAVVRTFVAVFPDALLWIDPPSKTGIVVGRQASSAPPIGQRWPGLARTARGRDLAPAELRAASRLDGARLQAFGRLGQLITDNNQLLAYGGARQEQIHYGPAMSAFTVELIERFARGDADGASP